MSHSVEVRYKCKSCGHIEYEYACSDVFYQLEEMYYINPDVILCSECGSNSELVLKDVLNYI